MQLRIIIILVYLFCFFHVYAQKETSNWYFTDHQGISFNTGSPQPITGIPANLQFGDNTIVCSDVNGNLNFICTNGYPATILDRNYNAMPGTMPIGNGNFARSLWAKYPGSASKYFIFYPVATPSNGVFVLQYAIIDMSLNNGLGQVTISDVIIDSSLSLGFCLINKAGSDDFWIINNKFRTDSFYSRLVTNAGINSQKTISVAGQNPIKFEYNFIAMKASPNGEMIAGSIYTAYPSPFAHHKGNIEVFNFDRNTGVLTNKVITETSMPYYTPQLRHLEFSPDSRLIYAVEIVVYTGLQPCGFANSKIVQYNLCYTDSVSFSKYSVILADKLFFCSYPVWGNMQMASDKQIYMRFPGNIMSTIKYPNKIGSSAKLIFNAFTTGSSFSGVYLPTFSQMEIVKTVKNNITYSGGCYPTPVSFSLTNNAIDHVMWNFGDPASGVQNTSTSFTPSHFFSTPNIYTVTCSLYNSTNVLIETLTEIVEVKNPAAKLLLNLPLDTVLCTGDTLKINLSVQNGIFEWSKKNPGNPIIIPLGILDSIAISSSGTYYVKMIQNGCTGCELYDSIKVTVNQGPIFDLGPNRFLCTGQTIQIGVPDPGNNITCLWNTGAVTDSIGVTNPGQYWVSAEMDNNGCIKSDTINFSINPVINFLLLPDTTLCTGQSLLLDATLPGAQYLWQDNSTGPTFNVTVPGLYWVRVIVDGCFKLDSINVAYVPGQQVNLGADTSLCLGNTLLLLSNITGAAYLWNNGAVTPSILVNSSGMYWVKVLQGSGCWTSDTINVQFNPIPYFSFGTDTVLCENKNLLLTTTVIGASYLWQDNSTATSYFVTSPGLYWLEVTKNGCAHRDSIIVSYIPAPVLDLGKDTSICSGNSLLLNAAHPNTVSYLWQNGSTNPTYSVNSSGLFFVEVIAISGCKKRDSITVGIIPLPSFNIGNDTTICSASSLVLKTNISGLPHLWSNGSVSNSITINTPGLFWAEVDNNGCKKRDSINILVTPSPVVDLGKDTMLCNTETILLNATNINASYLWQNGSTQPQFLVTAQGSYNVAVNRNSCYTFDTIQVLYNYKPSFSLGPDKTVCSGNPILLDPGITNANYLWQDGSTAKTYLVLQSGFYSVTITNLCGLLSDSVLIQKGWCQFYVPNSFTPDGDGKNDIFRPLTTGMKFYEITIFNRYGETVFRSSDPLKGWDGNYKGKKQNAGTYVWKCIYQIDNLMRSTETGTIVLIR